MSAELLRAIAAHGVAEPAGEPRPGLHSPLDDEPFSTLLGDVGRHRLVGLWLAAHDAGCAVLTPGQRSRLVQHQLVLMERCIRLDRLLLQLHGALSSAGVDHRFMKGVVHATTLYPDPALRSYGDVDLLVRASELPAALETLFAIGITRPKPELRPGYDQRFGKGITMRSSDRHGVDVHRSFASGPYAMTIEADRLFDQSGSIEIGGIAVPILAPTDLFLNACFNAAISDAQPTLISQRDVVNAVLDPELDWEAAVERAASWRAGAVVAKAVDEAWSAIRPTAEPPVLDWARRYRPGKREQRFVDSYRGGEQRWAREALAALPVVPGLRGKATYLTAVLLPTKEAAERRKRTRGGRLISGFRLLGRQLRPGARSGSPNP